VAQGGAKITDDAEALLCFFDFPAEHWVRCTSRLATRSSPRSPRSGYGPVAKGPGSKAAGLAMVFKLLEAA
jgi:putative transposase